MGSVNLSCEERIKRFLYTCNYSGTYVTGNLEKHISKFPNQTLAVWIKDNFEDFTRLLSDSNNDPMLKNRMTIFYIAAEALNSSVIPDEKKLKIKEATFELIKNDDDFFDFLKFFTLMDPKKKHRISTCLRKMIINFYQRKQPMEFADCVTRQDKYHGWSHKDLFKLSHYKCNNELCEPIVKYVLYGENKLSAFDHEKFKDTIDYLKKANKLRITEDIQEAVHLMRELHVTVGHVNSKLNTNEEIWLASLPEMSLSEILRCMYRFFKFGFLKAGGAFQAAVVEALGDEDRIRRANLHPVEVFIYLKFFERGGKPLDTQYVAYLKKRQISEDVINRMTTPVEPKCRPVTQAINRCLMLSYNNIQPSGKRFLVTIDVTDQAEEHCFQNKRITFLEAAITIIRFLTKVERTVTVAVFKDSQINVVDISRSHSAIERLQEQTASYIVPTAPIEWARNKKKQYDVFINFMGGNWYNSVPRDIKNNMDRLPDAINKYSRKMNVTNVKLVKFFLGSAKGALGENSRNILSIGGFSVDIPKVLESFYRDQFC